MELSEARANYFKKAHSPEGTQCPCCDRYGKIYKRRFNAGMARGLIAFYVESLKTGRNHLSLREISIDHRLYGDFGKMKHWKLVAPSAVQPGAWSITDRGRAFVKDRSMRIPQYVYIYDDEFQGDSAEVDEWTTIDEALGMNFSYAELMRDAPPQK